MTKKTAGEHSGAASAREIRKERARRLALRFCIWVVIPTGLAVLYYCCLATSQYESVSVFSIQSSDSSSMGMEKRDAMLVREHIKSRGMLARLAEEHGLVEHYQDSDADWWSRLSEDASSEETYDYYLDKVKVSGGGKTGFLTLTVRAYSAEAAQEFSRAILAAVVDNVNQMAGRGRREQIRIAEEEVKTAHGRLAKAREALLKLQGAGPDGNPSDPADAALRERTELEFELASARADFDTAMAAAGREAPNVASLRQRVRSVERQIEQANRLLVSRDNSEPGTASAGLESALLEKELAQKSFEVALENLDLARTEAVRGRRYLVTIAEPSLPDKPSRPRRGWGIATVFVLALVLMGVFTLLAAAVREHAKL